MTGVPRLLLCDQSSVLCARCVQQQGCIASSVLATLTSGYICRSSVSKISKRFLSPSLNSSCIQLSDISIWRLLDISNLLQKETLDLLPDICCCFGFSHLSMWDLHPVLPVAQPKTSESSLSPAFPHTLHLMHQEILLDLPLPYILHPSATSPATSWPTRPFTFT